MTVIDLITYGLVTLVLVYLIVRAASLAHFKTKLEYLRSTMKEIKGEINDGTE
jgi:hypothetical protein